MKIQDYLKKKGVRVAIIVLAVALVFGVSAKLLDGRAGFVTNTAGKIRAPIQKAASAMVDWVEGIYGYLYKYDQLIAETESLRAQLTQARDDARENAEAAEENIRLRELLNLSQQREDFVFESAKIVSWSASNWSSTFTISKGEKAGVEMGDCVVTEYGVLVGQIIELGDSWATVRTLIDTDFDCGALVGDENSAGIVVGDYSLMQDGVLKLTYLTDSSQIYVSDSVITSGSGGVFPQGLLIGTVTEIRSESGGQTYYGIVEPDCDLTTLSQVFIIKDYEIVE